MDSCRVEVDLHRLELRYAGARLLEPRAVEQLACSIDKNGQLIACIAVPEAEQLVLIDGYRRVAALRRLGRDTAKVERWDCDLAQGLITVLSRAHGHAFVALEEALLLRELIQGQGLSQHEVARRCGRDVSWVNRRLQLLRALPDAALAAVRDGVLSIWAATRVLVPLARANADHAEGLLAALRDKPLSTRELRCWFEQYQRVNRTQRERLVGHPHLFCDVVQQTAEQHALERLRAGPEGECLIDLRSIEALIARLRKRLPALCAEALPEALVSALARLQRTLEALHNELKRYCDHDPQRDPPLGAHAAHARQQPARDQPATQALT
jgi:ParB family chromosome partitioning protein